MSVLAPRRRAELADVVRLYGEAYRSTRRLSSLEQKALWAIEHCRTAKLGGHLERCEKCGHERPCYNSCRNRHCPKCQTLTKARWLEARQAEILPVPYFHVVFTLPHEINPIALKNKKPVYGLLFRSVSKTLLAFGKKAFEGKMGATMILHTWDQQLRHHIHVHCAVPAGALSEKGWVHARKNFLFPVKAMSVVFRAKFIEGLKRLNTARPGDKDVIRSLYAKEWVVYSKPAFQGAANVLDYLGRYTHRIAISNNRILSVGRGEVRFSYRDRADGNRKKETIVSAEEFLRRFLLHVLPPSFMKIRHIGFLANKSKKEDLARCRGVLGVRDKNPEKKSVQELIKQLTGLDLERCPACETGRMIIVADIPKQRSDSS